MDAFQRCWCCIPLFALLDKFYRALGNAVFGVDSHIIQPLLARCRVANAGHRNRNQERLYGYGNSLRGLGFNYKVHTDFEAVEFGHAVFICKLFIFDFSLAYFCSKIFFCIRGFVLKAAVNSNLCCSACRKSIIVVKQCLCILDPIEGKACILQCSTRRLHRFAFTGVTWGFAIQCPLIDGDRACLAFVNRACVRRPRRRRVVCRHGGHGAKAQGQGGAEDCGK